MATYAIGDLQGCGDEFDSLLERLKFDPARDALWLVGDLVNRGPRSLHVLRRVRSLGDSVVSVLGNHDLHLLAVALVGAKQKRQDTLADILAAPDRDELLDWLRHRPMLHQDTGLGYTMIHAGLPPQWDAATAVSCARELEAALRNKDRCIELLKDMYGDEPDLWSDSLRGRDRLRFITNCLTRLRFCHADGRLALPYKGPVEKAPPGLLPWFRVPERRSRDLKVVFGHWSALDFYDADGVINLDTGCVWGSRLTAIRLDQAMTPVWVSCHSSGLKPE